MGVELVMLLANPLAAVNAPEKVTDDLLVLEMPLAPGLGMLEKMPYS